MPFSDSPSPHRFGRRRLLKASIFGAATLALYSGGVERHWIEITRHSIVLPGLPAAFDGWRIAHLTDIHLDEFTEPFFLRHAIDQVNSLEPDAVLLTGDFISYGIRSRASAVNSAWQCAHLLTRSTANCDLLSSETMRSWWARRGLCRTRGQSHPCALQRQRAHRAQRRQNLAGGLDDPTEGRPNPDLAIPAPIRNQPSEPVLLMCHAPDYADNLRIIQPAARLASC